MINLKHTIVVVLRSGGDFSFRDVGLIARHINGKWQSSTRPRIICLWDNASGYYDLGNLELLPLSNDYPKWWSRMMLYSPEMEQYRPFLYVDLDTVIVKSLENIFELVKEPSMFIPLEDFYQKGQLATGLAWIPANSEKISTIWKAWQKEGVGHSRMDYFLRKVVKPDMFWQQLTNTIYDFKPKETGVLKQVPEDANLVCFHGRPRIFEAANASMSLQWVKEYVNQEVFQKPVEKKKVTVIIPYNIDRGYLKDAIASVPDSVQLIVSQGDGSWPQNFNKVLNEATGDYIKYLHEDDMLTLNCIEDSVKAIEEQGVDFIHGNAIQYSQVSGNKIVWKPKVKFPTLQQLLAKNTIHSATTMYRKEVFQKVGLLNETEQVKSFEEFEFNVRCLQMGMKIGYCNSSLAFYRRHSEQLIKKVDKVKRTVNRKQVVNKYKKTS
jgi:hypothetical protein